MKGVLFGLGLAFMLGLLSKNRRRPLRVEPQEPPREPPKPPEPPKPQPPKPEPKPLTGAQAIAQRARQELAFWRGKVETSPSVQNRLAAYWKHVLGKHPRERFGDGWQTAQPWSAAFVSYVVNNTRQGALQPSPSHWGYTRAAIPRRGGRYVALDPADEDVRVGDIIVRNRKNRTLRFPDLERSDFQPTHGDIVVELKAGGDEAIAIGGNLDHSVKAARYILDDAGRLMNIGSPNGPIALLRYQEPQLSISGQRQRISPSGPIA